MNILNRRSNNINIAQFWENVQLEKYNFNPVYQRSGEVWNENKKSFLIDSILKNFPMPPIFLHEHIDNETGKTVFDVIDGKQRLTSIIGFIKGDISLPINFSEGGFGDEKLNGMTFNNLDKDLFKDWKKAFWRYEITIEYIDTDQKEIVNNIFDRLNRNGEPLTPQELRKAKYNESTLYTIVTELAEGEFWRENLSKLNINRFDDIEFISELLFLVLEEQVFESDKTKIDDLYEKYCKKENEIISKTKDELIEHFCNITKIIDSFELDLKKYRIDSVSHLYGLWGFAWQIYKKKIVGDFSKELNEFYNLLRKKEDNQFIKEYSISMQSGTKSKSYRIKRINSLLGFCKLPLFE